MRQNDRNYFLLNYFYWYNRIIRVVPIRFAYGYMKIMVIVMIIFAGGMFFPLPNYEYYEIGIQGRVEKIECKPKSRNLKIGSQWYLVQMRGVQNIEVGNEIVKMPNSWILTIYDSLGNIRYQDSLKTINFNLMKDK